MAINISDLPPKYQAQAVKKYMEQQARRGLVPSAAAVQDPEKSCTQKSIAEMKKVPQNLHS